MKFRLALPLISLLAAAPAMAAGLGAPDLSPPIAVERFFDPDRLWTNAGVRYSASDELTLEPELGLGYHALEWEAPGGIEESRHQVHALAGWRLSLADTFHLSAAAKVPVFTVDSSARNMGQQFATRYGYDFIHPFRNTPAWTGEVGLRLSPETNLSLYYDQSPLMQWWPGGRQQEERIGTRIIWKFW